MVRAGVGALLVGSGPFIASRRSQLIGLAALHAIPAIYFDSAFVDAGGLISYGANQTDAYRRAGIYVARIIKGEKPGDLPVELPTKYQMVINLRTASAWSYCAADVDCARRRCNPVMRYVRYWHLGDICVGALQCPLLAQSGHRLVP